jgi:hypothetical protein
MQAKNAQLIRQTLLRDMSCLLHYLSGAWPWTNRKERDITARLEKLLQEEKDEHGRLAAVLRKQRLVPPSASFLSEYSGCHYLALDHLFPQLLAEQKRLMAYHQQARQQAVNDPAAEAVLDSFLAHKQEHVTDLEKIVADHAVLKVHSTVK